MALTPAQQKWADDRLAGCDEMDRRLRTAQSTLNGLLNASQLSFVTVDAAAAQTAWASFRAALIAAANALPQ